MHIFMIVRGEGDEEEQIRVARVVLFCSCFEKEGTESVEPAFM